MSSESAASLITATLETGGKHQAQPAFRWLSITGDRHAILRGARRHYGKETRQAAWERAKKIAKARTARAAGKIKVCPQQVNWDFCLFVTEFKRRAK